MLSPSLVLDSGCLQIGKTKVSRGFISPRTVDARTKPRVEQTQPGVLSFEGTFFGAALKGNQQNYQLLLGPFGDKPRYSQQIVAQHIG